MFLSRHIHVLGFSWCASPTKVRIGPSRWVSRNTRNQLKQLIEAVNQLMAPPDPPKRPIGFVTPEDKGKKTSGARGKT